MVARLVNAPTNLFIKFLSWLNRNSTQLLDEEKEKFRLFVESKNNTCVFFGEWPKERVVTEKDVLRLHEKYDKKADTKTSKRAQVAQVLQWVTLVIISGILTGIPSMDTSDKVKIILTIIAVFIGLVITKIQKSKLITIRIDAYKYRLKQIQLEKEYVPKGLLPADTLINKALRGSSRVEEEERDIEYEKYSLTNLELIIVFLIQFMYFGILVINFFIINFLQL